MTRSNLSRHPLHYARLAGLLYLVIAVFGAFSIGYVPSVVVAAGDAATTAGNLLGNLGLFRMGIVADIVVMVAEVALTAMLYVMFKPVSPTLSKIAAYSRLSMVLIMAINLGVHITPVLLLSEASYLSAFPADQLQAASMVLFDVHQFGIYIWQLFFALHLVALSYMIINSELFPRTLGWMMLVGSGGYFIQGAAAVSFTDNTIVSVLSIALLTLVTLGELGFAFWLTFKGVKVSPEEFNPLSTAALASSVPN